MRHRPDPAPAAAAPALPATRATPRHPQRARVAGTLVLALATLPAAGPAAAQASPYYFGGSLGAQHQSNLYRLGDGQQGLLPAGRSASDTVTTASLLAGIDQSFGRHRLHGDMSLRRNHYADNRMLDNDAYGADVTADWTAAERVSGSVRVLAHRNLARFEASAATGIETLKNIETARQAEALVRVGLVTRYSAELGYAHRAVDYSAAAYAAREYRQDSGWAALRWRPSGALTLGAVLRHARAEYPRFFAADADTADRQQRDDAELTVAWQPSGQSDLDARLGSSRTRYDRVTERDWSGLTGSLAWAWRPGGKVRSTLALVRDSGQNADFQALGVLGNAVSDSSRVTTALSWRGEYEASAKLSLLASVRQAHRALQDTTFTAFTTPLVRQGHDNTRVLSIGARWQPTRTSRLGCDVSTEHRSASGGLSVPLRARSVGCHGQVLLQ